MATRPTTELGASILSVAQMWIDCHCKEVQSNGGNCIDDLTSTFTGRGPWHVPYCAMTVDVWYRDGCLVGGFVPLFPITSGASMLLFNAKKWGFDVDTTPVPGCAFYRKSSLSGRRNGSEISGHCGVVFDWDDTYLYTGEGNSSQQIRAVRTTWARMKELGVQFIHFEQRMVINRVLLYNGYERIYTEMAKPTHCQGGQTAKVN